MQWAALLKTCELRGNRRLEVADQNNLPELGFVFVAIYNLFFLILLFPRAYVSFFTPCFQLRLLGDKTAEFVSILQIDSWAPKVSDPAL